MTQQNHIFHDLAGSDAGRQFARLRNVLDLVRQIAGLQRMERHRALDENARISSAYEDAAPIVRRRFDTLATEASSWAAAGVDALASADPRKRPKAAATRLAEELDETMASLKKLLRA